MKDSEDLLGHNEYLALLFGGVEGRVFLSMLCWTTQDVLRRKGEKRGRTLFESKVGGGVPKHLYCCPISTSPPPLSFLRCLPTN